MGSTFDSQAIAKSECRNITIAKKRKGVVGCFDEMQSLEVAGTRLEEMSSCCQQHRGEGLSSIMVYA